MTRKHALGLALGSGTIVLAGLTGLAGTAGAGNVLRVPLDHATIGAALAAASPGDEIRASASGSPYVENIQLAPGVNLIGGFDDTYTISNPTGNETVVSAAVAQTVIGIGAEIGSDVTLAGFTIRGGVTASGGGIFCATGSSPTITDCVIRDNVVTVSGAGIQIANGAAPRIVRCIFEHNVAALRGGGINVVAGADGTVIEFCTFTQCSTATSGQPAGGGAAIATASGIRFERNVVRENHSGRNGGGMMVNSGASVRAWGNQFLANSATFDGGAIYSIGGDGEHFRTTVEHNLAGGSGGGVYFEGGSNRFFDGFIHSNACAGTQGPGYGGGIYFDRSDGAWVRGTEIVGNNAREGGGIAVQGTPVRQFTFVTIESNTIMGNVASVSGTGAGIHVLASEFLGVIRNNIIAFQALGHGIACVGILASPNIRSNCVINGLTNPVAEYGGSCDDRTGINGNIRANPQFCCGGDLSAPPCAPNQHPDLVLSATSPCLGAGEDGVDLGAHPGSKACGSVSVEATSWGKIKAYYR